MESLNNYKNEFKKIKDENNKLKQNIYSNNNNNQNIDKNLKMKINNLIKEKIHY